MLHRHTAAAMTVLVLASVACGSPGSRVASAGTPSPPQSAMPQASGRLAVPSSADGELIAFRRYTTLVCAAFEGMVRAVGNPDTGSGSEQSKALDRAVLAGDGPSAALLAAAITRDLESGRRDAALAAAAWPSAGPFMAHLGRLMLAFEAMVAAKLAKAQGLPDAVDPQAAFEGAGGLDAWRGLQGARPAVRRPNGIVPSPCPSVPYVSP